MVMAAEAERVNRSTQSEHPRKSRCRRRPAAPCDHCRASGGCCGSGRRRAAVNYAQEKVIDAAPEARQDPSGQHFAGWKTLYDATDGGTNQSAKNVHAMADSILLLQEFANFVKEETLAAAP